MYDYVFVFALLYQTSFWAVFKSGAFGSVELCRLGTSMHNSLGIGFVYLYAWHILDKSTHAVESNL